MNTSTGRWPASSRRPGGACPAICWRTSGPSTCAAPRWPRRSSPWCGPKIAAFTRTPAYGQQLTALLAEALEQLSGAEEVLVTLRGDDLSFREALAASAPQIRLTFREGDFRLGGLIAESPDLGLRVDSSFDSAAGELSGHFAELFGLSLSDE